MFGHDLTTCAQTASFRWNDDNVEAFQEWPPSLLRIAYHQCTAVRQLDTPVPEGPVRLHSSSTTNALLQDSANLAVPAVTSDWKILAGRYPVHFSKSSCFDVLCHSLSLTSVSDEHFVCPSTNTVTSTISSSGAGVCSTFGYLG